MSLSSDEIEAHLERRVGWRENRLAAVTVLWAFLVGKWIAVLPIVAPLVFIVIAADVVAISLSGRIPLSAGVSAVLWVAALLLEQRQAPEAMAITLAMAASAVQFRPLWKKRSAGTAALPYILFAVGCGASAAALFSAWAGRGPRDAVVFGLVTQAVILQCAVIWQVYVGNRGKGR